MGRTAGRTLTPQTTAALAAAIALDDAAKRELDLSRLYRRAPDEKLTDQAVRLREALEFLQHGLKAIEALTADTDAARVALDEEDREHLLRMKASFGRLLEQLTLFAKEPRAPRHRAGRDDHLLAAMRRAAARGSSPALLADCAIALKKVPRSARVGDRRRLLDRLKKAGKKTAPKA